MLPGDGNNIKSAKLLELLSSLAESFLPVYNYGKFFMEVEGGFPIPIYQIHNKMSQNYTTLDISKLGWH